MAVNIEPVLKSGSLDPALLDTANTWFGRSWWGLMIAGGITALAACATVAFLILQFWSSNIKERFSDERIAANEAETKRAIADSDSAKEGTARANEHIAELTAQAEEARKETAQAKLELQQIRLPRSINLEKFQERIAKLPSTPFEVLYDANAPDAAFLASVIWGGLANLKWPSTQMAGPKPLGPPPPNLLPWSNLPWTLAAGGGAWGLSVVTNDEPDLDKNVIGSTLVDALGHSVSGPPSMVTLGGAHGDLPKGYVRIIVGPKLP